MGGYIESYRFDKMINIYKKLPLNSIVYLKKPLFLKGAKGSETHFSKEKHNEGFSSAEKKKVAQ